VSGGEGLRSTEDDRPARYVVGIDLGTTNSAVSFVDTEKSPWKIEIFPVLQVIAPGQVEARDTLPSFHYEPASAEVTGGALKLPWNKVEPSHTVGFFARDHGAQVPSRQIRSAKSWLCHTGVDRTASLLPWQGAADVERLSPDEASGRYLAHIREAWNAKHKQYPLEEQDVVLTLPASFDEVARELTVKAAKRAGLSRVVLIEEPQAAFYAWIYSRRDDWQSEVASGQKILVCDIGGGTSDFTLIRVRGKDEGGVQFHRVAVGNHLILGGDNLDLAVAHHVEQKLATGGTQLTPRQWLILVGLARHVKESLLGEKPPEQMAVHIPGEGRRLIGGGLQTEVTRDEVRELLLDGFLPQVELADRPQALQSGFQEFGLPYAADAAITRYLAAFLTDHRHAGDAETSGNDEAQGALPEVVLLNGGFFESPVLRTRLLDVLQSWYSGDEGFKLLDNARLDMAVASGAAYYGMVRRGEGERITGGLARTYYVGVASASSSGEEQALCLVPAELEAGETVDLSSKKFELLVSEPIEFPLYVSSTRLTDQPGELIDFDPEQMTALPPIRTVLQSRKKGDKTRVEVTLHAGLTEIGTLELWCTQEESDRRWQLQFDVRAATETDKQAHAGAGETAGFVEESTWQACAAILETTFGPDGEEDPARVVKQLSEALDMGRDEWPMSLLRRMWGELMELEGGRRRSAKHNSRWLNLVGFTLRPGYGLAVDDWRVDESWRRLHGKLGQTTSGAHAWILWRRIAGGLSPGQQQALADPLIAPIRDMHRRMVGGKGASGGLRPQDMNEAGTAAAAIEDRTGRSAARTHAET